MLFKILINITFIKNLKENIKNSGIQKKIRMEKSLRLLKNRISSGTEEFPPILPYKMFSRGKKFWL